MSSTIDGVEWISVEDAVGLRRAGVNTLLDLALTPVNLLEVHGLKRERAHSLVVRACEEIGGVMSGRELAARGMGRGVIRTGSSSLDRLLGGGVKTGRITDFFGASGTGKTQLCFQLSVTAQRAEEKRGARVLYVDTATTLRPERIREIAVERGLDQDRVLSGIYVVRPQNLEEQLRIPKTAKELLKGHVTGVLIIDTLTEKFLYELGGQADIVERQSSLARHLHDLSLLALNHNTAVVVTNTVRAKIEERGDSKEVEVGGKTIAHGVHTRIHLTRKEHIREARIVQPTSEKAPAQFQIYGSGVGDI